MDLSFFSKIRDLAEKQKELFYPKYTPQLPADINMSESIMKQIEEKDRSCFSIRQYTAVFAYAE